MSNTSDPPVDDFTDIDATPETDVTDYKAEAAKWKSLSKKNEDRATANIAAAKELERLRRDSMSDLEKAVSVARDEARRDAFRETGGRIVDAELRGALNGRNLDVDTLLEGIDRSRFLTDDGEPDTKAIRRWVDKIAPLPDPNRVPRVAGGPRGAIDQPVDMNTLIRNQTRRR